MGVSEMRPEAAVSVPNINMLDKVIAVVVGNLTLSLIVQSIRVVVKKIAAIKNEQIEDSHVAPFENVVSNGDVRLGIPPSFHGPAADVLPQADRGSGARDDQVLFRVPKDCVVAIEARYAR